MKCIVLSNSPTRHQQQWPEAHSHTTCKLRRIHKYSDITKTGLAILSIHSDVLRQLHSATDHTYIKLFIFYTGAAALQTCSWLPVQPFEAPNGTWVQVFGPQIQLETYNNILRKIYFVLQENYEKETNLKPET